jgi:hypothetical protein
MSYKVLQSFKKHKVDLRTEKYIPFLVVGCDYFSYCAYKKLVATHGPERVLWLSEKVIGLENLKLYYPGDVRTAEDKKYFMESHSELVNGEISERSRFIKEGEWKEFGGRTKGEEILPGEEFFVPAKLALKNDIALQVGEVDLSLVVLTAISKITISDVDNLAEPFVWILEASNGVTYKVLELIWGYAPARLVKKISNLEKVSNEFIEASEETNSKCLLHVNFKLKQKWSDSEATLFVPLSYTHPWGHFIGEFKPFNEESKTQDLIFIHFVDAHETSEEEISKKIKLLKRNFEKTFTGLDLDNEEEFILLSEEAPKVLNKKIDLALWPTHLHFVGMNALVKSEAQEALTHSARGLSTLEELS